MKAYLKVIEPKSTHTNYQLVYMEEMQDLAKENKGKVFNFDEDIDYENYFLMVDPPYTNGITLSWRWYWHKDWLINAEVEKTGQLLLNFD